jgi:phosphatidate cytidylyltransferase
MSEHPPSKKKFDPAQVGYDAIEQFEAAVSEFEEQVRDVNARIDKRAGRPLWQAIVFGLLLGGVFVGSLFWLVELFVLFVTALVVFAVLELAGALTDKGRLRSRWPLVVVSAVMVPLAAFYGPEGQLWSLVGAIVLAVVIRAGRALIQPDSRSTTLSDIGVAVMVLAYIPFLAGFAVAVATSPGGVLWLFSGVVIVVCVDVAAYATGLSLGRTPLAPKISPKKTWEGFAGSLLAALLAGVLLGIFLLGLTWWQGIIVGALLVGSATLGDLIESLIKRDLGIKDISSWLPGHGGFLDRLDSMLPSMAMLYVLFQIFG